MINKLITNIRKTNAPIVVGLDPMLSYIPEHIQKKAFAEYGETLEGAAEAIWQFNKEIIDKTYDLIPAVKPQIAMYEQFGIPGLEAFSRTVKYAKEKNLVIIGDVKRGDIGSTSAAYAVAHLGRVNVGTKSYSAFDEDFATVNPYLGSDGIKPFIDVCKEEKKGIFILVKTSNPSSGEFQDRIIDGRPLYEWVGEKVAEWGAECMGDGYSYVGAVVGATYPEMGRTLRKLMPKSFILVPGYGAQGGKGADLVDFFNEDGLGAIVNSSRVAGIAIFPAVFSFGLEPGQGPGLIFGTLPKVFSAIKGGPFFALVFFALVLFAAVTSAIALLEVTVSFALDTLRLSRRHQATILLGTACASWRACPARLSFGTLGQVTILNYSVFDFHRHDHRQHTAAPRRRHHVLLHRLEVGPGVPGGRG